ncbi:ABC transporter ATP-binding protein [Aeoliella sp. ICT_H6.2]|uniref:ABC transporter ATP-binding protein n=1 Tax=Aeoliella straminimaris TaxID=2954799 RepID=A0A9X2FBJ7_9BACT|nr:ABC transporter ATP-binding protein [Aeoliella straminimaris]MCO6045504.1 ABC transporter ATP-binding protein [Aeoliella straminimaris]
MPIAPALSIRDVRFRYGEHEAVRGVSFDVAPGEVFALLGPNGSGKTTLFRLISTLVPLQEGEIDVLGTSLRQHPAAVRGYLGVVFQSPSIDKKLTVLENLLHHGRLYGLAGGTLKQKATTMIERLGLSDKLTASVETLSGGQRRRVELAQSMLHDPKVLVLDEPATGLDPGARSDIWRYFATLADEGVTILLTTHLLEEAERADRLGIMHQGELVALDTPLALQASLGGDTITLRTTDAQTLADQIASRFDFTPAVVDGTVRLEHPNGHQLIPQLVEAFGDQIDAVTLGKPTLEDVFIARTGHQFFSDTHES